MNSKSRVFWPRRIKVRVPATTSNLGPGFDVLGMALKLYCELELKVAWPDLRVPAWRSSPRNYGHPGSPRVIVTGEGAGLLPEDATNMVVRSFHKVVPVDKFSSPLEFRIHNEIPLARGLGSSAAARLCGLLAAGALTEPTGAEAAALDPLVAAACRLEGHPDNVVPAVHGGLRASMWSEGKLLQFGVNLPKDLGVVVCVPEFEVSTPDARKVLPEKVPLQDAVSTSSRLAFLIAAIERGNFAWLKSAMRDVLHQPPRRKLVPGMDAVIRAAEDAGAFGAALSGSGPTILALSLRGARLAKIGRAMQKAFFRHGAESRYFALDIDTKGARVDAR